MLARNSYDKDYIAASRARVEAQLAAYRTFERLFYDALIHELDNHEPFGEQAFIELSDAFLEEMEHVYG